VARLLEGLARVGPPESVVVLDHRRSPRRSPTGRPETHYLRTPPHHRLEGWLLPAELVGLRLALLHSPDVVVPAAWRGCSVATVHDVDFLRHPERLSTEACRYYSGVHRTVRRAERVIAVSEHTRRELDALTEVLPDRIRVVPNAIAPRYFAAGDPAQDRRVLRVHGLQQPYLLYVSTIEPRKNVGTLLQAFRRLRDEYRDVHLVLAGADGWLSKATYDQVDQLGLRGLARFLGFVPDADLPALYRGAAVLAHPAWDEGFGLTPLEAMACGTPVVASSAGALPEVLGSAAAFAPPDDPAAWAVRLGSILDQPALRAGLVEAGRRRAGAFTVERQAVETLAVYRQALAERRARSGAAARRP
jgi:glycosyltransferase involved in cell wall biosynthesis